MIILSQLPGENANFQVATSNLIPMWHNFATHLITFDDPMLFHSTAERFLRTAFRKVDIINDTVKSLEKMRIANQH